MLHIAICDDDKGFLKRFEALLTKAFSMDKFVIEAFNSGQDLIAYIEKNKKFYDIIFLDIEMPDFTGFQTAERLNVIANKSILIFTTHLDNEVQEGYKYNAFRFILKSNIEDDLAEAVVAIRKRLGKLQKSDEPFEVKVRLGDTFQIMYFAKKDIIYFDLTKKREMYIHLVYTKYQVSTLSIREYLEKLGDTNFKVVLRHYIVNFDHILDISGRELLLTNNIIISLGQTDRGKKLVTQEYMEYKIERM